MGIQAETCQNLKFLLKLVDECFEKKAKILLKEKPFMLALQNSVYSLNLSCSLWR